MSVGYALVFALTFGALFAYVSGSSLVLIGMLGVTPRTYALLFACSALGLMVGALLNARLSRRGVSSHRLMVGGLTAIVATALVLGAVSWAGTPGVASVVPLAVIGFIGQGVVRPNAAQGALEPVPESAGVAGAVMSGLQMLVGAAASAVVAALFDGTSALAMTVPMMACSIAAAIVYLRVVRPAELRRLPAARDRAPLATALVERQAA